MSSTEIAKYTEQELEEQPWLAEGADSLDELKDSEIPTPRLKVNGSECVFENADTAEKYPELEVIILGLVRSRIMWPEEVKDDAVPMCRSLDAKEGLPGVDPDVPVKLQFPWRKSNFERANLPIVDGSKTEDNPEGQPKASCEACIFKDWNTEADKPGPCTEQLTLPVYYKDRFGNWAPGILTFARSGFTATTRYLGYIKAAKQTPFMFYTTISLEPRKRGEVDYAVPKYAKGDMTEAGEGNEYWRQYFATFNDIKEFLRRPRRIKGADDDAAYAASEPEPDANAGNWIDGEVVDPTVDPADAAKEQRDAAVKAAAEKRAAEPAPAEDEELF